MKSVMLVASAMFAFADVGNTADLTGTKAIDWSGFYIGAQAGHAWGKSYGGNYFRDTGLRETGGALDPDGFFGGFHAGYNYQFSNSFVLGVEGDVNFANIDSGVRPFDIVDNSGTAEMTWNGSIRARVGYAFDRFLPFVTAGYAFGRYKFTPDYGATPALPGSKVQDGYTLGAGLEYAVTENIRTRIEYRFTDYGKAGYDIPGFPGEETRINLKTNDIRIGLSYRF